MNSNLDRRHVRKLRMDYYGGWLLFGAVSGVIALVGASFGVTFIENGKHPSDIISALTNLNGRDYQSIVEQGYRYTAGQRSAVAFFPAYPLVAKGLAWSIGAKAALVVVSNICCLGMFALMGAYLYGRDDRNNESVVASDESKAVREGVRYWSPTSTELEHSRRGPVSTYAVLSAGLLPTTCFFRVGYTESMFLCIAIAAMYAIARGWRIPIVALLVGASSSVRPVGIGLLLPLVWYIAQKSSSFRQVVERIAYAVPLGCWGLLAYMAYQYCVFGDPFAFYKTQYYWRLRPDSGFADKLLSLVSWEPIWSVYVPGTPGYWKWSNTAAPFFNLQFANPIYFVGSAVLIAVGVWRRWLTCYEVLLAVALLAIPYVTRAYEMCMLSQGRFSAVVFPIYIVLGQLLARMPRVVAISILTLSGILMAVYTALFAAGYSLI